MYAIRGSVSVECIFQIIQNYSYNICNSEKIIMDIKICWVSWSYYMDINQYWYSIDTFAFIMSNNMNHEHIALSRLCCVHAYWLNWLFFEYNKFMIFHHVISNHINEIYANINRIQIKNHIFKQELTNKHWIISCTEKLEIHPSDIFRL